MGFNGPPPKRASNPFISVPAPLKVTNLVVAREQGSTLNGRIYAQEAVQASIAKWENIPILDQQGACYGYTRRVRFVDGKLVGDAELFAQSKEPAPLPDGRRTLDLE